MKVLLFFFDGARYPFLEEWTRSGELPFLAKLRKKGLFGKLKTTIPAITHVAITAMSTGKNAGKTSIYTKANKYGKTVQSYDVHEKAVWDYLSAAGYSSLVYYVPMTYPPKPLRGVMVSGHDVPPGKTDIFYPADVAYQNEFISPNDEENVLPGKGFEVFLHDICQLTTKRFTTLQKLEKKYQFDFTFFSLPDSDRLQHFCFHRKDLLLQYFKFVDRQLETLTKNIPYDVIFVTADHGFEPTAHDKFSINTWLIEHNYLSFYGGKTGTMLFLSSYDFAMKHIPLSTLIRFRNFLRGKKKMPQASQQQQVGQFFPGVNWKTTKAYANNEWGIRLTPHATDEDKRTMITQLSQLQHERKPLWKFVAPREEIFSGLFLKDAPDIVFLSNEGIETYITLARRALQRKESHDYKFSRGYKIEGMHDYAQDTAFFCYGKHVKTGEYACTMYDILPTLLSLFGIPLPKDLDGKVIPLIKKSRAF